MSQKRIARGPGRPRSVGVARAAIVAAADALFYEHGVGAVSMDDVAAAAGVSRRTLYYHFANREALVESYLLRRDAAGRATVANAASIEAAFVMLERWFASRDFRGCAITNAAGENIVLAGPIATRHKAAIRDTFVRASREGGATEPEALGEQLMLLFDGALVAARIGRGGVAARHARAAVQTLLGAHGVR